MYRHLAALLFAPLGLGACATAPAPPPAAVSEPFVLEKDLVGHTVGRGRFTTITKVDDLNGKNVCSVQGSTSENNVKAKAPQANLLSLTGYAACVDSLKSGRVDAVSTDDIILAGFAASDNTLKLVGGQFTQEPYGIGIKKGNTDMAAFIDALLAKEFSDGTWDKTYDKYLGKVEGLPKAADARAKLPATN